MSSESATFGNLRLMRGRGRIWGMPDDKTKRGEADRKRINKDEPYEVRDAAKELKTTEEEILKAIAKVGNKRKDVKARVKERKKKEEKKRKKKAKGA